MSRYDYEMSTLIAAEYYPFHALIMAAMRQADTRNTEILKGCWPDTWDELVERYHTPGGYVKGEVHD